MHPRMNHCRESPFLEKPVKPVTRSKERCKDLAKQNLLVCVGIQLIQSRPESEKEQLPVLQLIPRVSHSISMACIGLAEVHRFWRGQRQLCGEYIGVIWTRVSRFRHVPYFHPFFFNAELRRQVLMTEIGWVIPPPLTVLEGAPAT